MGTGTAQQAVYATWRKSGPTDSKSNSERRLPQRLLANALVESKTALDELEVGADFCGWRERLA
jgi:hypothetical protein